MKGSKGRVSDDPILKTSLSFPTHSPNPSCNLTDDVTYSKVKDLTTVFSILKGEREKKKGKGRGTA